MNTWKIVDGISNLLVCSFNRCNVNEIVKGRGWMDVDIGLRVSVHRRSTSILNNFLKSDISMQQLSKI